MKSFVEDKDIIFHLAGINRTDNNGDFLAINVLGTLNLLEAIIKYSTSNRIRFVFTSTLQVYGYTPFPKRLKESSPLRPTNIYGLSKKFAEEIIYAYCKNYGIKGVVLRISNVYGPGCKPFYNSVVSTFVYQALRENSITIRGSGNSSRDFIYVADVIDALMRSALYNGKTPDIFNVCTGIPISVNELVRRLEAVMKRKIIIKHEMGEMDNHLIGDPSKAQQDLNFIARTPLEEGLIPTIDWLGQEVSQRNENRRS